MSRGHSWKSFKVPEPECTPSPHLKVNVRKIKHQAILLHAFTPWYFQVQDKAEPGQNDAFMLRCSFLDLECKILDWQACRLSKQSLSFVVSVWYPVSRHDHYTLTQKERFHKLARERHDQRSRKKEFGKARWEQESSWNSPHGCIKNTWNFWNHVGSGPNRPKGPVCISNLRIHEKPKTCQRSGSFFQ